VLALQRSDLLVVILAAKLFNDDAPDCAANFFECASGFARRPILALNADLTANYTKAVCNEYNAKKWPGGAARRPGPGIHTPWPESESMRCQNRGKFADQQEPPVSAAPFVSVRP
jgi:hypothetical protein